MIGIRRPGLDIGSIKQEHTDFIGKVVKRKIEFYIEIFNLLIKIDKDKKTTNTSINTDIKRIKVKTNSDDYKFLLKQLLLKEKTLENEDNSYVIAYKENRKPESNNFKETIKCLKFLLSDYEHILSLEFTTSSRKSHTKYLKWKTRYRVIGFLLPAILDYDHWFANLGVNEVWGPYQLTRSLNLNCCPYCNRQYTFTVSEIGGSKVARPELDHFLPKNSHPLLALSFYNLIPSCSVCNSSVKGASIISYETHLNPYEINEKHSSIKFTYYPNTYEASVGISEELTIGLKYNGNSMDINLNKKTTGNIELFCLNELYANHVDIVQEIIRKRSISNDRYIEILQKTFQSFNLSIEETYQLAYGNFYRENDFHKRPLSKLTKDIAIELGALIEY